jgi:hypothetical protein
MAETCPNCGCRVYRLGCVNCDEPAYIDEQVLLTESYGEPQSVDAVDPVAASTEQPSTRDK